MKLQFWQAANGKKWFSERFHPYKDFEAKNRQAMPINRPAIASAVDSSKISVVDYFDEKHTKSSVILIPPAFEFSGEPSRKLGEEAEKNVFDSIEKCGRDIPRLKIICFHGVRVIGGITSIIREVDQCCFLTYQAPLCKCLALIQGFGQCKIRTYQPSNWPANKVML